MTQQEIIDKKASENNTIDIDSYSKGVYDAFNALSWQPIDPNNLPNGEVLATDGAEIAIGYLQRFINDSAIIENKNEVLYNCTHYIDINKIPIL